MTIRPIQATDRAEWDTALSRLSTPHVLQTWDWGDFKSRWGWQPTRLLFEEKGKLVAAAQILKRRLPLTPFSISYVPKGPALDYEARPVLIEVLSALEQQGRAQNSLLTKIDPDVWLGDGSRASPPQPQAARVLEILAQRGWRPSTQQIQFKNTVRIGLHPDEDRLLAAMKSKTRYNVRLSSRRGVRVRPGGEGDLNTFYNLYDETSQRDGFIIRPPAYYLDVWERFITAGRARLLLAEVEGIPVAGLILFHFGQIAWYMYGASSGEYRNLMPNYLLQWEAMRLAKALGCSHYDMWGAPDRFDENDPMWGVYRFKTGFGGKTMRGMGAFDHTPRPGLYWAYTVAMPRLLDFMRRRHQPAGLK